MDSPKRAPLPTEGPTAGGDEFDDLFDYDVGGTDDPFSDNYVVPGSKERQREREAAEKKKNGAGLGIDEEIEVTRKPRAPRAKLDEQRLLSAAGIPKLRKKAASHLKFKGKGHEYSDAARMLAFYQLWLDDLFPKARFLDALAMVEKMGHKKQMQIARMEWINEGKTKSSEQEDGIFDEPELPPRENGNVRESTATRIAPIFENRASQRPKTPPRNADSGSNDLYDVTPMAARSRPTADAPQGSSMFGGGSSSLFGPAKTAATADDEPPDDELEALLAEEEASREPAQPQVKASKQNADEFDDDDLEALLAEEEASKKPVSKSKPQADEFDDDDLDALLAEEEMQSANKPTQSASTSRPSANEFDEDMDAMEAMEGMDEGW